MADSRLRRFVGGLGLGYIHTIVTIIVGLWLTPYVLRHLGPHDYGLWLLGAQVLIYLALMDLGIVQLVPRDVAIAAGRANGDPSELQAIVGQTARLVLWQLVPVALVGSPVLPVRRRSHPPYRSPPRRWDQTTRCLGQGSFSCTDRRDIGRRERQLGERLRRTRT
jgi:O-antigen/teichoic acid export membrane protein